MGGAKHESRAAIEKRRNPKARDVISLNLQDLQEYFETSCYYDRTRLMDSRRGESDTPDLLHSPRAANAPE
ncbi:uncharacterized protein N7511_010032 [Penicillium nucicola]|uniref:uncharacterized protein n=1 Tax=Penicillium nucicola TaxID=1850975 RepID=UPI002544E61C|nr:uncharacterized protein N7511_010032 [Penicillium nucicola]KAJ5748336.1 hypothetical protein N7511_010032 [Penicillium nucicola]